MAGDSEVEANIPTAFSPSARKYATEIVDSNISESLCRTVNLTPRKSPRSVSPTLGQKYSAEIAQTRQLHRALSESILSDRSQASTRDTHGFSPSNRRITQRKAFSPWPTSLKEPASFGRHVRDGSRGTSSEALSPRSPVSSTRSYQSARNPPPTLGLRYAAEILKTRQLDKAIIDTIGMDKVKLSDLFDGGISPTFRRVKERTAFEPLPSTLRQDIIDDCLPEQKEPKSTQTRRQPSSERIPPRLKTIVPQSRGACGVEDQKVLQRAPSGTLQIDTSLSLGSIENTLGNLTMSRPSSHPTDRLHTPEAVAMAHSITSAEFEVDSVELSIGICATEQACDEPAHSVAFDRQQPSDHVLSAWWPKPTSLDSTTSTPSQQSRSSRTRSSSEGRSSSSYQNGVDRPRLATPQKAGTQSREVTPTRQPFAISIGHRSLTRPKIDRFRSYTPRIGIATSPGPSRTAERSMFASAAPPPRVVPRVLLSQGQ